MLASLTLLEWGALLIYLYFSGRLASLLHPNFHGLVLATGFLLTASGGLLWWRAGIDSPDPACTDGCCDSSPGFSLGQLPAFLVLSVPIAFATIVSPDRYGSVMVRNRGIVESIEAAAPDAPLVSQPAAVPDGPILVEVGDLLVAAQAESTMAQYAGKRVELIGQFSPLGDKEFEVVRMLMLCCAADAQMLAVRVESKQNPTVQAMQWVKVAGRVSFEKRSGRAAPVIAAERVTATPEPADRYVYRGGARQNVPMHQFKFQLPPH